MENIYLLSFDSNCGKGGILKELEVSGRKIPQVCLTKVRFRIWVLSVTVSSDWTPLRCVCVCVCVCVALFATPWTAACQAPCVHGMHQGRRLEWVDISFSRGSSQPRDQTWVSCIAGRFFAIWDTREVNPCTKIYSMNFTGKVRWE